MFPFWRELKKSTVFHRYYASTNKTDFPPEVQDYNKRFTKLLEHIKARHDPTVTTVAQGVLEWKRCHNARHIGHDIQSWLDRFYMSRIGIRFLIGQRKTKIALLQTRCIQSMMPGFSDVALNTHQAHEDYVGIICTKAVEHLFCPSKNSSHSPQTNTERTRHRPRSHRKRPICLRRTLRHVQRASCPTHMSSKPHIPLRPRAPLPHRLRALKKLIAGRRRAFRGRQRRQFPADQSGGR